MKFKISYNRRTRNVYISKSALLILGLVFFAVLIGVYRQKSDTQSFKGRLGIAPVVDGKLPKDKEQATELIIQETKKEYGKKLTIIFFYDGYENQEPALKDIKLLQNVLETVEPYKSLSDMIAYKIVTSEGRKCEVILTSGFRKSLLCDNRTLEGLVSLGIEHVKLVTVTPEEFSPVAPIVRGVDSAMSASMYKGKLTQRAFEKKVAIEFALGLGKSLGLFPEHVDVKDVPAFEAPNCARDLTVAKKLWGRYINKFKDVGYFQGCGGSPAYYFPQKNTLMSKNPDKLTYGVVAEDYLRGVISCFYAEKEAFMTDLGGTSFNSCKDFKSQNPNFWKE